MNRKIVLKMATLAVALGAAGPAMAADWSASFDNLGNGATGGEKTRQFPATCVTSGKMIVAGGFDDSGAGTTTVYQFDPSQMTGSQWVAKTALPVALGEAEMTPIPGTSKCLLVGGRTNAGDSAALSAAYIYDPAGNAGAGSWTATAAGFSARVNFKVSQCAGNRIIVVGGTTSGAALDANSIQVYNYNGGTDSWTTFDRLGDSSFLGLNTTRAFPALTALSTSYDKFLIAGGENSGGVKNTVEILQVTNACAFTRIDQPTTTITTRTMAEAALEGTSNVVLVLGGAGTTASDSLSSVDKVTVTVGTPSTISVTTGTAMDVARRRFALRIVDGTSLKKWAVIGGIGNRDQSVGTSRVWDGQVTPAWSAAKSLNTARYGMAAEYLTVAGKNKFYVSGGLKILNDNVFGAILKSTEESPAP